MGRLPDTARVAHWCWRLAPFLGSASVFASLLTAARAAEPVDLASGKKIAVIVTIYTHNSHADMIVSRLLQTDTLDGKGKDPPFKLVGALHALLISEKEGQRRVETPYLMLNYQPSWRWTEPPPLPPMRHWAEQ